MRCASQDIDEDGRPGPVFVTALPHVVSAAARAPFLDDEHLLRVVFDGNAHIS